MHSRLRIAAYPPAAKKPRGERRAAAGLGLPQLKRAEGKTLGTSVLGLLSARLMAGEYAPGDHLSLRSVAEALGVSVTPVREAINRLVAEDALEMTPNKAVRVPMLDVARFRELTLLRIDIEGSAAYRAALSRDAADLAAVEEAEARFRAESAKTKPNLARAVALNQKLHFAIYRCAKSPMLLDVISSLWLKAGPILNLDMRSRHGSKVHAEAVAAIRERNGPTARMAISEDIRVASEFIIARNVLPK
jgi:DNA-binding GntR family transcriptional regulator